MSTEQSEIFQNQHELTWEAIDSGIQRQVFGYNTALMMVKVKFEKGALGAMHSHPHVQTSYVASGSFELTIGNEKKILKEGDGYFVPPHVMHGCVCIEAGMLIDAFSPLREDFLNS